MLFIPVSILLKMEVTRLIQNIPETGKHRVVIIGAGFGGLELTKQLCRSSYQVILLDRNNYHQFQPLLYQVATAGLEPTAVSFPIRKFFQKYKNVYFRVAEILSINTDLKEVTTNVGRLKYDTLVLAAGTKTNFFGNSRIEQFALQMKSTSDSIYIRNWILENFERALNVKEPEKISEFINIAIVGGGPTGVELAGALAEMKKHVFPKDYPGLDLSLMKIALFQGSHLLLAGMSAKSSAKAKKYLEKLEVEVHLNSIAADYDGRMLRFKDGSSLISRNVIWAAGVSADHFSGISSESVTTGNRLLVDRKNKVLGYSDVYAIGDLCLMKTPRYPGGHPQVAQVAIQQARLLAINLKKSSTGKPLSNFEYKNKGSMATIGRNLAVADFPFFHISGFPAWIIWSLIHLITLVGGKNKLSAFLNWIWKYLTYDQSLRLVIKPSVKVFNEAGPAEKVASLKY